MLLQDCFYYFQRGPFRTPSFQWVPYTTPVFGTGALSTAYRLKSYLATVAGTIMVEIRCPHCEEDVELEEDAFGLFDCPHCNKEYEYESSPVNHKLNKNQKKGLLISSLVSIIVITCGVFLTNSGIEQGERANEEQEEKGLLYCSTLYGSDGEVIGTDNSDTEYCNQENTMFDNFFFGVIVLLIGSVVAISSFVVLLRRRVRLLKQ